MEKKNRNIYLVKKEETIQRFFHSITKHRRAKKSDYMTIRLIGIFGRESRGEIFSRFIYDISR